ncbi:MAG: hypothetical protein GYA87_07765, partial [Christensenellaceae bacterium]|nr:hypothetical protein [Christensenellaceae bacterium]
YAMLITGNNRLGLSLMLETFVDHQKKGILDNIQNAGKSLSSKSLLNLSKNKQIKDNVEKTSDTLNNLCNSCVLCESIDKNLERYAITVLEMWKNETPFKEAFANSKGFCIPHIAQLLKLSYKYLNAKEAEEFTDILYKLTENTLARQEEELKLFIKKYDYRYADLPWDTSKDSLERIINKMQGWCVGEEPHPEDRNKDRRF